MTGHDCAVNARLTQAERDFITTQLGPSERALGVVERIVCERSSSGRGRSGRASLALYADLDVTRAVRERDGNQCRFCGDPTLPRDRRSGHGEVFAFIDMDAPITPENVVVACRGCCDLAAGLSAAERRASLLPVPLRKVVQSAPSVGVGVTGDDAGVHLHAVQGSEQPVGQVDQVLLDLSVGQGVAGATPVKEALQGGSFTLEVVGQGEPVRVAPLPVAGGVVLRFVVDHRDLLRGMEGAAGMPLSLRVLWTHEGSGAAGGAVSDTLTPAAPTGGEAGDGLRSSVSPLARFRKEPS